MSTGERRESPTGYYHVMQRGVGKQILFEDENDNNRYLRKLVECKEELAVEVIAYCLMDNHVHLLVKAESVEVLSKMMMKIGSSYAKWYNVKYDHVGYVFQGRFLSEPIWDENYLLACVRYIHNNPVKAGFGRRDEYRWSSYNEYYGTREFVDPTVVEGIIGSAEQFEEFSSSADDKIFIDTEINAVTCSIGLEIVRKHFGNDFENSLMVKQLCVEERNKIIREMKNVGMNNHQIELVTGVSRALVKKIQ